MHIDTILKDSLVADNFINKTVTKNSFIPFNTNCHIKSLFRTVCGVRVRFILNDNEQNDVLKWTHIVKDQIFIDFIDWTFKLVKRRRSIPIKWLYGRDVWPWVRLFWNRFLLTYFMKLFFYQRLLVKFYFLSRKTVLLSIQSWVWTYAF